MVFTIDSIRSALSKTSSPHSVNSDGLIEAAVAILVYPKPDSLTIILNKRTDRVEHHKGEISFPGGGRAPEDDSILDTALRETREEMGIAPEDIEIIAQLDQVSTRSGFSITPFVGIIPPDYDFEVSNIEIAEVLEVPIESLLDTENQVIPGLFAAGELTGGIFYNNYPGGAGLMAGSVYGKIAGDEAASHSR